MKIDRKIFFITTTLPLEHGGRTASILHRAKVFSSKLENNITILTTNYNPNYREVIQQFLDTNKITKKVKHINIYEDIMPKEVAVKENNYIDFLKDIDPNVSFKNSLVIKDNKISLKFFQTYKNKFYNFLYKTLSKMAGFFGKRYYSPTENKINITKYKKVRVKMEIIHHSRTKKFEVRDDGSKFYFLYDNLGNVFRTVFHPKKRDNFKTEEYYNQSGVKYLTAQFKQDVKGKWKRSKIVYWQGKYTDRPITFNNELEFYQFWYENIIPSKSSVICDARLLDKPLINIKKPDIKKFFQLHSNHLTIPNDESSNVKGSYKNVVERIGETTKVVTCTQSQADDLILKGCPSDKLVVIPHSVKGFPSLKDSVKRKHVAVIARLSAEKRIEDTISAIGFLKDSNPELKMHLYGNGNQEGYLRKLTKQKGIDDRVFFHGHVSNIDYILKGAKCSVLTSKFEGFALVVQESLVNGSPVISYDIKYGPAEMIKDGINGFLIEEGRVDLLAQKIQAIMSDDVIFEQNEVQKSMASFSPECFVERWADQLK